ncbi:hypothetical protein QW131_33805 [Roseibium salinum]|nr:hypothetical protein [Roseibium salinum]
MAQTSVIAIVAIGQHLVILTRGIDLSVGANLALATVVGGLVFRVTDSTVLVMGGDVAFSRYRRSVQWYRLCLRASSSRFHHHPGDLEHLSGGSLFSFR